MAARFCSQCGRETSSAARFCPHCGAPAGSPAPTTRVDAAAQGTRRVLLPLAIAVLVVLAVAVAVLANRLHQESLLASRPQPLPMAPPLTNAPVQPLAAPPLTNAPTQPIAPAAPLTNAPSTGPGQLPPDVAAYLQFLKGIEERRVALSNDTSGATAMLSIAHQMQANQSDQSDSTQQSQTAANGTAQISQGFSAYNQKWQTLVAQFRSRTPPPACTMLASEYWKFLGGYAQVLSQLQVALLNGNLGAAMSAQGAQAQINQQALQADGALSQLCQRYNAPKPFNIQPDGSSSSLLGM